MPAREVDRVLMGARGISDAEIIEPTRVIAQQSPIIRPTHQAGSTATTQQSASTAHHVDADLVHNSTSHTVHEDPVHTTTSPTHPRLIQQAASRAEDHHGSYMLETDVEEDESSDESSDEAAAGHHRNVRRKVESGLVEIQEDIRKLNGQIQEVNQQMQELIQHVHEMSQQQTHHGVILSEIKEMLLTLLSRSQAISRRPPSPPRDDPHTDQHGQ